MEAPPDHTLGQGECTCALIARAGRTCRVGADGRLACAAECSSCGAAGLESFSICTMCADRTLCLGCRDMHVATTSHALLGCGRGRLPPCPLPGMPKLEESMEHADAMLAVASAHEATGGLAAAAAALLAALQAQERVVGSDDPSTYDTLLRLARAKHGLGELEVAARYASRCLEVRRRSGMAADAAAEGLAAALVWERGVRAENWAERRLEPGERIPAGCGVRLGFLRQLCEAAGASYFRGRVGYAVEELGERVVAPATRVARCRYVDLLPRHAVVGAEVAVVYEAGASLAALVDGLAGAGVDDDAGVWLDVLALGPCEVGGGDLASVARAVGESATRVATARRDGGRVDVEVKSGANVTERLGGHLSEWAPPEPGTYEGEHFDGRRHGRGTFFFSPSAGGGGLARFEGQWCHGRKHGPGAVYGPGGTLEREGWWLHGAERSGPPPALPSAAVEAPPAPAEDAAGGDAAAAPSEEEYDIDVVPFEVFKELGRFPRSHERRTVRLSSVRAGGQEALAVFVSHRWLLPFWPGADTSSYPPPEWYSGLGIDPAAQGYGHPDDINHSKAALIIEAVEKLVEAMVPDGRRVCLWADYACIDQDAGDKAAELLNNNMLRIIGACDVMLTPVVDDGWEKWDLSGGFNDLFNDYGAEAWRVYWSRGWCRLEAFSGSNLPVARPEHGEGLLHGLRAAIVEGKRRPHLIYGTSESKTRRPPRILPPLRNAYFTRYHPAEGNLTSEADRATVSRYVEGLEAAMPAAVAAGYEGETDEEGRKHGVGVEVFDSGNRYEGEYRDGKEHGQGTFFYADGDRYEGEFRDDKRHGQGTYFYADGGRYEGEYRDGKEHGQGTCFFADGDRYEGEWRDGKRHGQGTFFFAEGDRYEGEYRDGKEHGQGTCFFADGGRYEGEFRDGKRHGQGTFFYAGGSRYEGEWRDDKRHGQGTFFFADGDRYEGEYRDGKEHGQGTCFFADGGRYEGEFRDGKRHGQSTFFFANGNRYEGEYRDDKMHGQGTYFYANGSRYEGEFRDGKRNGRGTFFYASGNRYEGEYRDGKRNGRGTYFYADGNRYEGEFRDGKEHGRGTFFFADGARYEGEYRDDKMHGQGTYFLADGGRYEGEWRDGKEHGQGTFFFADGARYEGEYRDGKMHGQGTYFLADGGRYEGELRDGDFNGQGSKFRADGSREYEGEWRDDKRHGAGVEYAPDGSVSREGEWEAGVLAA